MGRKGEELKVKQKISAGTVWSKKRARAKAAAEKEKKLKEELDKRFAGESISLRSGVQRGQVVILKDKETEGSIQRNMRPAVVVQNDIGNLYATTTIVVPLTSKIGKKNQPTHALVNHVTKSLALCEQVTTVDRMEYEITQTFMSDEDMRRIDKAIIAAFFCKGGKKR